MSKSKGLADKKLIHALLPGAKVENEKGQKISMEFGFCRELVHFNIGGTLFETYRSTLYKQPNSPLADDSFLKNHYRPEANDYFFDRDPDVFKIYGWFSLFIVLLSIFSFVVETHPYFAYSVFITEDSSSFYHLPEHNQSTINNGSNFTDSKNGSLAGKTVTTTHPVFYFIDTICLGLFTLEYILRVIFARKKIRYISSLMGVIDLAAVLPDYIQFVVYSFHPEYQYDGYVGYIAVLRIARVLRVFRLIRHVPGLWILIYTLKSSIQELLLMSVFLLVGMLVFSSFIYFVDDQEIFKSIPHSFWWALVTMTTVGYGDMVPKTSWGYVVGSLTALSGLLMIGFSVPVLVNNFIMYYKHIQFISEGEYIESLKKAKHERGGHSHELHSRKKDILHDGHYSENNRKNPQEH